jgi:hypothetical protein
MSESCKKSARNKRKEQKEKKTKKRNEEKNLEDNAIALELCSRL